MEIIKDFDATMTHATAQDVEAMRQKLYWESQLEVERLTAKLARAERRADNLSAQLAEMIKDIRSGTVFIDCDTCKGAGEFTEIERGNPYTARELKCSDCDATGQVEYKCVQA